MMYAKIELNKLLESQLMRYTKKYQQNLKNKDKQGELQKNNRR